MLKENPSKSMLADFGQSVASKIREQILLEKNPNADSDEVNRFYQRVTDISAIRQNEYLGLFETGGIH